MCSWTMEVRKLEGKKRAQAYHLKNSLTMPTKKLKELPKIRDTFKELAMNSMILTVRAARRNKI